MGRSDYQTWEPSNVLMPKATAQFSQAYQDYFRNRKINRPIPPIVDSHGQGWSGSYDAGNINVWRHAENIGGWTPTLDARHELLHAASLETPYYRQEIANGLPELRGLLEKSGWPIPKHLANDAPHIFTALAETLMDNPGLAPPPLVNYFAPLLR
ncbi:MAG: hypothetical protein NUW01_13490 [Gemmatimonadaceae bacterium]|nr:hypothetical protein [Gemmatimonadaceae bacterium]